MKLRNSNIEILRIVGMFMIVLSHSAIQSGFKDEFSLIGLKSILLKWKELGNLGVAIFAIISVYYSAFKESTKKNTIELVLSTTFYGSLISSVGDPIS